MKAHKVPPELLDDRWAAYVRGWFDRSSAINVSTKIVMARSSTVQPIHAIHAALARAGIENSLTTYTITYTSLRDDGIGWELRISRREALTRWQELIGFSDPDRASKLKQILDSYAS
jgi:hypothetical protein